MGRKLKSEGLLVKKTYRRKARHLLHNDTVVKVIIDIVVLTGVLCQHVQLSSVDIRYIRLYGERHMERLLESVVQNVSSRLS